MAISTDLNSDFLSLDEKERYKKHLTLKEIGVKGQLKLKNSSVICIGAGGLGSSVFTLSCRCRNRKNWNS